MRSRRLPCGLFQKKLETSQGHHHDGAQHLPAPRHSHRVGGAGCRHAPLAGVVPCVLRVDRRVRAQTGTAPGVLEEQDRGSAQVSQGRSRTPVSGPS
eukprot:5788551-Lingulodinium_polyedra.AAC.1